MVSWSQCTFMVMVGLMTVGMVVYWSDLHLHLMQGDGRRLEWTLARMAGPLPAEDPLVVQALKARYLDPPSSLPHHNPISHAFFSDSKGGFTWPWINYHLKILFSKQHAGFFIEAGALDGVYLSNTLWLEQELDWKGLLIEPDEANYAALRERNRRSWSSNTCVSSEAYPTRTVFVSHSRKANSKLVMSPWSHRAHGHVLREDIDQSKHDRTDDIAYSKIQCFPLVSYLAALNVTTVDLLILDIQGTEAEVIRNYVTSAKGTSIRVIVAENEYKNFDDTFMKLMDEQGYILLAGEIDYIFVRKDDPVMKRFEIIEILKYYANKKLQANANNYFSSNANTMSNEEISLKQLKT